MNIGYAIRFSQDGNMVCATYHDFINLQESPAGFGETRRLAMMALQQESPLRCQQALWWGYGAPAGVCGEPAYGNYVGLPRLNNQELWFTKQTARCPNHGGPTWEKATEEMIEAIRKEAERGSK